MTRARDVAGGTIFTSADHTKLDGITAPTISVTIAGGKFVLDGTSQQTALMVSSGVYKLDQSHSSNANHPLRFSLTSDGTHGGGSAITTDFVAVGTAGQAGAYVTFTIQQDGANTYYYYCGNHSGMGGAVAKNHHSGAGNNHVPTGGATGQSLVYASAGTAAWGSAGAPFAGAVATLTSSGTLTNNQKGYQILINGSGVIVTLPTSTIGMYYVISNAGNAAFQILGTSNQPVGGANTYKKIEIGGSVIVAATGNGTGWTITGVNSEASVLTTTYDVTAGSYTHTVASNTAHVLVCAWGATASAHVWFKNYVYTTGGTGGGNYAEKFIASPASSYAVVIGGNSPAGGSAANTTVAGITCAGGPPKPVYANNAPSNGPVAPPAAMPTGGDYAARGGNGSLYSGDITGGGGGSASRGGTGGNAGTVRQGSTAYGFGGGGTGGNDAPTATYSGADITQGAPYTARNASTYDLSNLGVVSELGSGSIKSTGNSGQNFAGKGASSQATLTLGGSQTVNIVIGSLNAGRGSGGGWTSGHQHGSDAGCVTFVEFTESV